MTTNRALQAILRTQWACRPEYLHTMIAVASRALESPEAVLQYGGHRMEGGKMLVRDSVAIIPIHGGIFRHANLLTEFCGATSIESLAVDFGAALSSPDVRAIILDIDSPGGEVNGTHEFAAQVKAAGKPVSAYVGSLAASGAYWIASAADEIVVDATSRLGSIGVVMGWTDDSAAQEAAGLKSYEIVSSQSPKKRLDPASGEGRAEMQTILDGLADIFIADVAANRGVSPESVIENFGQGGVLLAESAISAGMADRLGSLEGLIAELSAKNTSGLVILTKTENQMSEQHFKAADVDREWLKAHQPALLEVLQAEAAARATAQERERVAAIDALNIVGHAELVKKAKAEGSTPEALAMAVVTADHSARKLAENHYEADAKEAVVSAAVVTDNIDAAADICAQIAATANARRKK